MKFSNHSERQYLNFGEAKIYYEETGNKNKTILLLLHGDFGYHYILRD
jgi:hypothetical protein